MNFTAHEQLETVLRHIDGAYGPNTLSAYRAEMLEFIRHCEENSTTIPPATPSTVASFLLDCTAQNIKTATLRRKVSSISATGPAAKTPYAAVGGKARATIPAQQRLMPPPKATTKWAESNPSCAAHHPQPKR